MLLRSEMKEEVMERRNNGNAGSEVEFPRGRRRNYEERVTYRTITRTEFQKRRASFESREEEEEEEEEGRRRRVEWARKGLQKKTRSMDELTRGKGEDRVEFREREMTEKLENIHRMIADMQEMTKRLKDRKYSGRENAKLGMTSVESEANISGGEEDSGTTEKPLLTCDSALTVKPVRYRSTILIVIGSKWKTFKEEIELKIDSRFLC